ncbi:MAG: DUF2007 domain-containing protein [Anaerolineaceae bacterium]|nr:DUF2007 domain-containing protein [Anaerolineaceae bacterium]
MFKRTIPDEVVYIANGMLEGESVRILLDSFGIPAYLNQESAGTVYGLTVGQLGEVQVSVAKDHLEDAKKIIAEMIAGNLELPDGDEPEDFLPE